MVRYTPIVNAGTMIGSRVNLIGIIVGTTFPRKSKGTDLFMLAKIIDPSYPLPGLTVNIFTAELDNQPMVLNAGDIVILFDVKMCQRDRDSEPFAVFYNKFSSFALFEGKDSTSYRPYQYFRSSSAYGRRSIEDVRDCDKTFIGDLRKWLLGYQMATDCSGFKSIQDIRHGDGFNLVCKILQVRHVRDDEWMLLVWDGTNAPPGNIVSRLDDEMENPLPLQSMPVCLPREVMCNLPPLGTVLRITQVCGDEKVAMSVLKANRWVKFDNLRCERWAGLWHASLLSCTRFGYLHDDDNIALQRTREYDECLSSGWKRMPLSCVIRPSCVTEADHPDVPFVTLMRALAHDKVVGMFRCVVRVVAQFPLPPEQYISREKKIYRIRLTLEDPTARIHAYLCAKDAEKFFGGYPDLDVLRRMRNRLLGVSESVTDSEMEGISRDPPWIMCCLKSYNTGKNDTWGSRKFRIFATTQKM